MSDLFQFRRFQLELDGVIQGAFTTLELPGYVTRVEVGEDARKVPGTTRRTHARLTEGLGNSHLLFRWFEGVLGGEPDKRAGAVIELGDDGEPRLRHEFQQAWPVRVRLGALTPASPFEVAELELAVGRWSARRPSASPPG